MLTNMNRCENLEKIKIKHLTKEQLVISIDRLTRFKVPEHKYLRVFKDVISSALLEPHIKKNEIDKLSFETIREISEYIINSSLENLGFKLDDDYVINQKIYDYENSTFVIDENVNELLKNRIHYKSFVKLIENENDLPFNLKWLRALVLNCDIIEERKKEGFKYPLEKVILAEGITEEILLPAFGKVCGCDFNKKGIYIISAGGKNQVVKYFYEFAQNLKIPVFILLDNDAKNNYEQILPRLRSFDKIHIVNCGEFEDLLPLHLVEKALNSELKNISIRENGDINPSIPMAKNLEELFKKRGLHEFKKSEFAKDVKSQITSIEDVSEEIIQIFTELSQAQQKI